MKKSKAESNKLNGQKSTGPIDTSISRFNATKHGQAGTLIGVHEQEAYDAMLEENQRSLLPEGAIQEYLVRRITLHAFRSERCATLAAELHENEMREVIDVKEPSQSDISHRYVTKIRQPPSLLEIDVQLRLMKELLLKLAVAQATEADIQPVVAAMESVAAILEKLPRKAGAKAWEISEGAEKLHRHEIAHENRFVKLLNEFERLKRLQRGENIPAPLSINMTHSQA